jgi:hypothetical protein
MSNPSGVNTGKCVSSGGTIESGFSETGGSFSYCKCPSNKYEYNEECKIITNEIIQKCESLANRCVTSKMDGNVCKFTWKDSGTTSTLTIWQILDSSCRISNPEGDCGDGIGCFGGVVNT